MEMMEILALIPARGGSKSIKKKNIVDLAGKPLVAYSIETAKASRLISRVVVSTDDTEIKTACLRFGAEVPFLRPVELAQDDTLDWPVFFHALRWLKREEEYSPDIIVHLRPTTPLRRWEDVDASIRLLMDNPMADAIRSVSPPIQNPFKMWTLEERHLIPLLDIEISEPYNQPRQKLPTVYWQNGYIDVTRRYTIIEKKSMTGDHILPYVMDNQFIIDIDQPLSLKWAEFLLAHGIY